MIVIRVLFQCCMLYILTALLKKKYVVSSGYRFLFGILWLLYGIVISYMVENTVIFIQLLFFSGIAFMGATIDQQYYILPNEGMFLLGAGYIVRSLYWDMQLWSHGCESMTILILSPILRMVLIGLLFCLIRLLSHGGLGCGDIKWGAAIALWIPWEWLPIFVMSAFVLGTISALGSYLVKGRLSEKLPFGPYLVTAATLIITYDIGL